MKKRNGFRRELTPEQKAIQDADRESKRQVLLDYAQKLMESEPFWFYEPSDGYVSPDGKRLLEELVASNQLLPEDIPQKFDCQLDVHQSPAQIRAAFGGNQVGKSTIAAIEAIIKVTGQVPFSMKGDGMESVRTLEPYPLAWKYPEERLTKKWPVHVRVIGQDYVNGLLKNLIPAFRYWVPREFLLNKSWEKSYSAERKTLTLYRNDNFVLGTIEFMSNEQDVSSFQGPPRDMMIYDEQPREDIRKENLMRFTTRGAIDELYTMTPTEGLTWTYEEILLKQDGKTIECFKLASITNKKANIDNLRLSMAGLDRDTVKMRLLGEFVSLTGLVYGNLYNPKIHDIEPFEYKCNCGCFGYDGRPGRRDGHTPECPWNKFCGIRGMDSHLVTPTHMVQYILDREGTKYIVGCYNREADTDIVKADLAELSKGIRQVWTVVDKSTDSDIEAFGGKNIFKEFRKAPNQIPGLRLSQKFDGSIRAGVDEIKKDLKVNEHGRARMYIFNIPETKELRMSLRTLQKDSFADPEKGPKDKIKEGRHHYHAAMRYPHQFPMNWIPPVDENVSLDVGDEALLI